MNTPVVAPTAHGISHYAIDTTKEINAKFLYRNGICAFRTAEGKMAKIRKALDLKSVSIGIYCEYYKTDLNMFYGKK